MLDARDFFDLDAFTHAGLFDGSGPVWNAIGRLKAYMDALGLPGLPGMTVNQPLPGTLVLHKGELLAADEVEIVLGDATKGALTVRRHGRVLEGASVLMAGAVFCGEAARIAIGRGVLVESGALIKAPAVIGDHTEIRQGAYLRGYCLTGRRCVVGHTTEVKHSIFLDDAKAGHFAYLGDSILGNNANLGAGTKMANLRFTGGEVPIRTPDGTVASGLRKLGAIVGDRAQTGCNSVTNPGTLLGRKSMLLPNTTAPSGYHPPGSVIR